MRRFMRAIALAWCTVLLASPAPGQSQPTFTDLIQKGPAGGEVGLPVRGVHLSRGSQCCSERCREGRGAARLLDWVSLNRTLSYGSLCLAKQKPFVVLAGGLELLKSRGDWHSFEPLATLAERYVDAFGSSTPPHLLQLAEIARKSA